MVRQSVDPAPPSHWPPPLFPPYPSFPRTRESRPPIRNQPLQRHSPHSGESRDTGPESIGTPTVSHRSPLRIPREGGGPRPPQGPPPSPHPANQHAPTPSFPRTRESRPPIRNQPLQRHFPLIPGESMPRTAIRGRDPSGYPSSPPPLRIPREGGGPRPPQWPAPRPHPVIPPPPRHSRPHPVIPAKAGI